GASRGDRHLGGRRLDRRHGDRGDGRAVFGGVARASVRGRREGQGGGRADLEGGRVQAAHVAVLVPGARGGGAQVSRRGQGRGGAARRHRGHGAREGGSRRALR